MHLNEPPINYIVNYTVLKLHSLFIDWFHLQIAIFFNGVSPNRLFKRIFHKLGGEFCVGSNGILFKLYWSVICFIGIGMALAIWYIYMYLENNWNRTT
jgi:hypothetical protein